MTTPLPSPFSPELNTLLQLVQFPTARSPSHVGHIEAHHRTLIYELHHTHRVLLAELLYALIKMTGARGPAFDYLDACCTLINATPISVVDTEEFPHLAEFVKQWKATLPPPSHPEPFCLVLIYHLFLIATLALLTTEFVAPPPSLTPPFTPFPWTLFLHQLATFLILDTTLLTLISLQTPILATIPEDLTSRTPRNIHP